MSFLRGWRIFLCPFAKDVLHVPLNHGLLAFWSNMDTNFLRHSISTDCWQQDVYLMFRLCWVMHCQMSRWLVAWYSTDSFVINDWNTSDSPNFLVHSLLPKHLSFHLLTQIVVLITTFLIMLFQLRRWLLRWAHWYTFALLKRWLSDIIIAMNLWGQLYLSYPLFGFIWSRLLSSGTLIADSSISIWSVIDLFSYALLSKHLLLETEWGTCSAWKRVSDCQSRLAPVVRDHSKGCIQINPSSLVSVDLAQFLGCDFNYHVRWILLIDCGYWWSFRRLSADIDVNLWK